MDINFVKKTPTKLAGTSFQGRQPLLERVKEEKLELIELAREPDNEFDSDAITATVTFRDETQAVVGHVQNSDRKCLGALPNGKECGAIIEGSVVSRSRTVCCPGCGFNFAADRDNTSIVMQGEDKVKYTTCPKCVTVFPFAHHNIYIHSCGCSQQLRVGLASTLCRGMEAGIVYKAKILEVTGGGVGEDNKPHNYGCNILIEKDEMNSSI